MSDPALAGMVIGLIIGGFFVAAICLTSRSERKLENLYNDVEYSALKDWLYTRNKNAFTHLDEPKGFQRKLSDQLTEDFFKQKGK